MKKICLSFVLIVSIAITVNAQRKLANYAIGDPSTEEYEHFGFYSENGKPTNIHYAYGKDYKELELKYLGKSKINGQTCFKVMFPNKYVLYFIPQGLQLQAIDAKKKYNRTFSWEHEGPIDGRGTFCEPCAEGDKDAMDIMSKSYLK